MSKKVQFRKLIGTAIILSTSIVLSCSPESKTVYVQADSTALEELKASLQLNYANDALLTARVNALEASQANLITEQTNLQLEINNLRTQMNSADSAQSQALQVEINNRIAADQALQAQYSQLSNLLNTQVSILSSQINVVNNGLSGLTNRVLALESLSSSVTNLTNIINVIQNNSGATQAQLDELRLYLNNNFATVSMLNAVSGTINNNISNINNNMVVINNNMVNLQTTVQSSQTQMIKAPCTNSKEFMLKINGKFYAAMNIFGQCSELDKVYLTELQPNTLYTTTDGANCKFKVINGSMVQQ